MVAPEPILAGRRGPEPYDTWQCVDACPTTCLDLKLVCRGTWSAGYRQSISICFVRAWKTGLAVMYVAPKLSHHRQATSGNSKLFHDCLHPYNFGSGISLRALHDNKLFPRYMAKPPVERLSSRHLTQSATKKALILNELSLLNLRPKVIVPCTYLNILLTAII
jgi:hypothetical protein